MSDLISRQAVFDTLIEKGQNSKRYKLGEKWELDLPEIIEAINAIPSAEPEQKWIPVTEALPKNSEFVLLTIRRLDKSYSQIPFISVGYVSWNQSAWWCAHDGDCDVHNMEVLAWMPLPELWRGE